jgi:hypothetical protein
MAYFRQSGVLATAALAVAAAGCSGGGSSPAPTPSSAATPPAILVAGNQRTFTGTDTTTHVYASPSPGQANYTSASTFAGTTTINTAASGAPAAWDINSTVTYTVTQAATTGTQTLSTDTDTYENQTMSGSQTTISETGSKSTTTASDVSAAAAGGGPFTLTTKATTAYVSPFTNDVYPLQTGPSITEPLARTITESQTDLNAGGGSPPSPYYYVTSEAETYNNDGSYMIDPRNYSNGDMRVLTESSNGSASQSDSTNSYAETIGVPQLVGGIYKIPVAVTNSSGSLTTNYDATDWYAGNALPTTPLETETVTVKGETTTLPAACAGALAEPNVFEVDTNISTLNVFGSSQTELQQAFNSNGINDCLLRTTTTMDYSVETGNLTETTTDTYAQILTNVGTESKARQTQLRRT